MSNTRVTSMQNMMFVSLVLVSAMKCAMRMLALMMSMPSKTSACDGCNTAKVMVSNCRMISISYIICVRILSIELLRRKCTMPMKETKMTNAIVIHRCSSTTMGKPPNNCSNVVSSVKWAVNQLKSPL